MDRLSSDENICENPPKPDVPDWLSQYVDEVTGMVDYDQLIRDGRYNEYIQWQQNHISPVPPVVEEKTSQTSREIKVNVWSTTDTDFLN